jgi:membrane protein DedA with SNARE-associated domain
MLSAWPGVPAWIDAALSGVAQPSTIALALALTTLLLEDLAIAAGVALAAQGAISWGASFAAVSAGIAAGDVGLYALGAAAMRWPWLRRGRVARHAPWVRAQLEQRLPVAVLLARVIPGLRLVTYTASGFLRVPLLNFYAWVTLAVLLWTAMLYSLGVAVGQTLTARLGISPPLAVALPILVLAAAMPLLRFVHRQLRSSSP